LVNKDNNIQIIDSGATDFTYEVDSILEKLKEDEKREILIFGQQLIVTLNTFRTLGYLFQKYKFQMLPSAIKNLKKRGITPQEVGDYLSTVKDDTQLSYSYMLNYYGNPKFVPNDYITPKGSIGFKTTKKECIAYMKRKINEMFNLIITINQQQMSLNIIKSL
jgi:hypothetical protein